MPPRTRKKPDEDLRAIGEAAGYVDPYPELGLAPVADINEDRCVDCAWTLFVTLRMAVYCINPKCPAFHLDLTQQEGASEPEIV